MSYALLYTGISAIVGLFLAAGAVLLIDYFDDTLKSSQKIRELLGIPVLGKSVRLVRSIASWEKLLKAVKKRNPLRSAVVKP